MLPKSRLQQYRSLLFRHLDGLVTGPTAYCLFENGLFDMLLSEKVTSLETLTSKYQANEGYLNVALRVLASQGWLHYEKNESGIFYHTNDSTGFARKYVPLYRDAIALLTYSAQFHPRKFDPLPFERLERLFEQYGSEFGTSPASDEGEERVRQQVLAHMEGLLIGPSIVLLGMNGMFHQYFMKASFRAEEFHKEGKSFGKLLDFFVHLGWFQKLEGRYQFTDKGLFFAKRASAYGVTVSYLPMFRQVQELIFGNPHILSVAEGEREKHVDREMNVWGSGGAHAGYFKKVDDIIIEIFNRPIEEQPEGILDMGCGNGAFIEHIFDVIERQTDRGKMLDEYPVLLVGADYNKAALDVARSRLIKADIWAKMIWGDISRPHLLAKDLQEHYGISLENLLNVRTFLDHNRIWEEPEGSFEHEGLSTGAFAYKGKRLDNAAVEENLRQHFLKWAPYIQKFGLLVIELHTLPPSLTAANPGKTAATAYDATHGFSDQYILEAEVFLHIAKAAGLYPEPAFSSYFPEGELATVSIHLLKGQL
jgi:SAM-dependent methyltransferase